MSLIFKTDLIKGATGDTGNAGASFEIPTGAVIYYDGTDTPDGYEDTTAPEIGGEVVLCGQDFTTQAAQSEGVSFYYSDTTTLMDSLPATNGIDTSLVTNERLNLYTATPIGAGCSMEITFGDISASGAISDAIQIPTCDDYIKLRTYNIDASGNLISDSLQNVANISDLANNVLKIKGEFYMFSNDIMQVRYKVYIGSTQIDQITGELGDQTAPRIISGIEFTNVGTAGLNMQIKSLYVKGVSS